MSVLGTTEAAFDNSILGSIARSLIGTLIDRLLIEEPQDGRIEDDDAVATFTVQADLPTELVDTRSNRVLARADF